MKRAILFSGYENPHIAQLLREAGFLLVEDDPDLVVTYGGDGTLMRAEEAWPSVPKLMLKGSRVCKLCNSLANEIVIRKVAAGEYALKDIRKIEAVFGNKTFVGLNDIIIHNENPRHGIRYRLLVDGEPTSEHEIIGDGVVIATPFGSTGYYRSITHSFFTTGIGIAFNNSTEQFDHMVLQETVSIAVTILRGPAAVYADNGTDHASLGEGDTVTIQRSDQTARIIVVV